MNRDPAAVRVYGAVTRLYPARFRDEYGDDMVSMFREQCRDEPAWRVLSRTVVDLAITVPTQHMEAKMRRTATPFVSIIYLAIALAGVLLAVVGGTNATIAIIGLSTALGVGTVGVIAWRRATPVRDATPSSHWWKFVLTGPVLVATVIIAAGQGVEAWELGVATVLTGFVLTATGLALGVAQLVNHRVRRIPT